MKAECSEHKTPDWSQPHRQIQWSNGAASDASAGVDADGTTKETDYHDGTERGTRTRYAEAWPLPKFATKCLPGGQKAKIIKITVQNETA